MSCGISEEEIKEQIALKDQIKKLDTSKCRRCDGQPFVLLQKKDVFCRLCFKEYCEHKFRSTIGKTKLVKPQHRVLIAFSGGQNSTAMLDLALTSLAHPKMSYRLVMQPFLVYIDETAILDCELKSKAYNDRVNEILSSYKVDKYYSKLEMYFSDGVFYSKDKDELKDSNKDLLHKTLNSFKSFTAKEEFLRRIRINLICRIARAEQMDYVFLGPNATRLSIQLLTDVAQGRGNQVDSEMCFEDNRHSKLKLLKPMREFHSKEVTFWNKLKDNDYVEIEDLMTKKSAKSSIGKITEQFINYLQKDYPATTYTISKIGYKLQNQNEIKRRCLFCQSPVDELADDRLSAQMALVITNSFESSSKPTFNSDYCYGCNILLRETDKPDDLLDSFRADGRD